VIVEFRYVKLAAWKTIWQLDLRIGYRRTMMWRLRVYNILFESSITGEVMPEVYLS
jgi:hypothetical protein